MEFATFIFAAVLIEAVVTTFDNAYSRYAEWKFWVPLVLGIGVGVLVAVNYGVDLFSYLGLEGKVPVIGAVLTGIVFGRGANYVSDIMSKVQGS